MLQVLMLLYLYSALNILMDIMLEEMFLLYCVGIINGSLQFNINFSTKQEYRNMNMAL